MLVYASYEFYTDEYGGTLIPENEFKRYSKMAEIYVDNQTANRSKVAIEDEEVGYVIKMVVCKLAELEKNLDDIKTQVRESSGKQNIKSETVGTVSVSYDTDKKTSLQALKDVERSTARDKKVIVLDHLWQYGLLHNAVEIV